MALWAPRVHLQVSAYIHWCGCCFYSWCVCVWKFNERKSSAWKVADGRYGEEGTGKGGLKKSRASQRGKFEWCFTHTYARDSRKWTIILSARVFSPVVSFRAHTYAASTRIFIIYGCSVSAPAIIIVVCLLFYFNFQCACIWDRASRNTMHKQTCICFFFAIKNCDIIPWHGRWSTCLSAWRCLKIPLSINIFIFLLTYMFSARSIRSTVYVDHQWRTRMNDGHWTYEWSTIVHCPVQTRFVKKKS